MTCRWIVGGLVAALALWGGPAGPAQAVGKVTIALFTPLTRSQADVGAFNKNAVEMAVEDVNAAGGI